MRKFLTALCAVGLALAASGTFAASGKAALLAFAKSTSTAQGIFTQKVVDKNGPVAGGDSSGRFIFERPGKFVWETVKPYPQTIVSDAKTVYVWDPDLNQVTIRKLTEAMGSTPAVVLFGKGDIEKSFTLADIKSDDGLDWVSAEPKTEDFTYKRFEIGFDGKGLPAAMRLLDHFGQTVTLAFSELAANGKVDTSVFVFKIPQGADVLQDTH